MPNQRKTGRSVLAVMLSKRPSFHLLWGSALLLCGCNIPEKTPPLVTEVAPATLGLAAERMPQIAEDWWTAFNDPQADRLIARMLQDNPTLQGALARIRGAEAELAAARSQSLPQVALDGALTGTRLSDEYILPAPYGGSWQTVGDVQARMRWSLAGSPGFQLSIACRRRSAASMPATVAPTTTRTSKAPT